MYPSELVHMGCLTIESGKGDKDVNILVITDHLMRYTHVIITNLQTAKVMAQVISDMFITTMGCQNVLFKIKAEILKVISSRNYVN